MTISSTLHTVFTLGWSAWRWLRK